MYEKHAAFGAYGIDIHDRYLRMQWEPAIGNN
jgi:hypothetical protein